MSGVFQNIAPPPTTPLTARQVCTPQPLVRGEDTLAGRRGGWWVNCLEDARHCSVLYLCKYFVVLNVRARIVYLTALDHVKSYQQYL
jgi:hypothetical protein